MAALFSHYPLFFLLLLFSSLPTLTYGVCFRFFTLACLGIGRWVYTDLVVL